MHAPPAPTDRRRRSVCRKHRFLEASQRGEQHDSSPTAEQEVALQGTRAAAPRVQELGQRGAVPHGAEAAWLCLHPSCLRHRRLPSASPIPTSHTGPPKRRSQQHPGAEPAPERRLQTRPRGMPSSSATRPQPLPCCRLCSARTDPGCSQGKAWGRGRQPEPALCPHPLAARPPPNGAGQQPPGTSTEPGQRTRCCCSLPRYRSYGQERQGGKLKVPQAASIHLGQAEAGRRSPPACLVGAERGTSWNKDLFRALDFSSCLETGRAQAREQ